MEKTNSNVRKAYFDSDTTLFIKGIAIILMFLHHFFTFPKWYIDSISYPELETFALYGCFPLKLCVAIFVFLTGYLYEFNSRKNFKYVLRKTISTYISYWTVYVIFLLLALLTVRYKLTSMLLLEGILGLQNDVVFLGWYIPVYCIILLVLTTIHKLLDKGKIAVITVGFLLPLLLSAISKNYISYTPAASLINWFAQYFQVALAGYLCSHFKFFEKDMDVIFKNRISSKLIRSILMIVLMGLVLIQKIFSNTLYVGVDFIGESDKILPLNLDMIYGLVFVYALVNLYEMIPNKKFLMPVRMFGKYSLLMWLLHSLFFGCAKEFFQPLLYFPKNPVLVTVWGLLLCFALSYFLQKLIDLIIKKITV